MTDQVKGSLSHQGPHKSLILRGYMVFFRYWILAFSPRSNGWFAIDLWTIRFIDLDLYGNPK